MQDQINILSNILTMLKKQLKLSVLKQTVKNFYLPIFRYVERIAKEVESSLSTQTDSHN